MRRPSALSKVWTTCYSCGELQPIEVQTLVRGGLPRFDIIGLPQNMIREGKDRILSALGSLGIELPSQKILVSLNPGDIPKEGSHFDLPIIIGILRCLGHLPNTENKTYAWGELGLDGSIRPFQDLLAHLLFTNLCGADESVSGQNENDLSFVHSFLKTPPASLRHVSELFDGTLSSKVQKSAKTEDGDFLWQTVWADNDPTIGAWNRLRGSPEQFLFWCLTAIGRHHVLLEGPPGVGKSSWCFAFGDLQRPLRPHQWVEKFRYRQKLSHEIGDLISLSRVPFEAPHHTSSSAAVVGGGSLKIAAGALTRSHLGILFLDEFSEFSRDVLESLREPLETKSITIARRGHSQKLAADTQLLAAMNPCKCGKHGSSASCDCTTLQYHVYRSKISAPLRDRFHFQCWWFYDERPRPEEFELKAVRRRLIESTRVTPPRLEGVLPPRHLNPRRQARWLETFVSWCRWFNISTASPKDVEKFLNFLKTIKNGEENYGTSHELGGGTGSRGTATARSHLVS